jgi:acyl-CoA synthetase (AMP-forming)/AMP-acid ligase II
VYPAEVERVLSRHPGVQEVAVVGCLDGRWGEVGHAFVVPRAGAAPTAESVLGFCEGKLARYKHPVRVTFCADFPRTAVGKVQKYRLRESVREEAGGDAPDR